MLHCLQAIEGVLEIRNKKRTELSLDVSLVLNIDLIWSGFIWIYFVTLWRCLTLEEMRRNLTFLSPAKAKESMVLMGLSLITIIAMFSDPAKAYPDRVWILEEEELRREK